MRQYENEKILMVLLVIELQKIEDAYARLDEFLEQPCHQRPWQEFQRSGGVTSWNYLEFTRKICLGRIRKAAD
jgi:hypothetical protein